MRQPYPEFIQSKLEQIRYQGGVRVASDDTYTYVLLALGERRTGGYRIEVIDSHEIQGIKESYILVRAKEIAPQPGDFVTQVITYPVEVYRLPVTNLPIKVEWVRSS